MGVKKMLLQLFVLNLLTKGLYAPNSSIGARVPSGELIGDILEPTENLTVDTSESETSSEIGHVVHNPDEHKGMEKNVDEPPQKKSLFQPRESESNVDESQQKPLPQPQDAGSPSQNEGKTAKKRLECKVSTFSRQITDYDQQLGGHHGIKKDVDGFLLKPVLESGELKFYEAVAHSQDAVFRELKSLLAEFGGTKIIDDVEYIRLRNITENFGSPCIMDIKIGFQIWDPTSSLRKIEKRKKTYVAMRNQFHFVIQGFEYNDILKGPPPVKSEKADLKQMTPEEAIKTLYNFVNGELGLKAGLVEKIVKQLKYIASWFERQGEYKFYASSILITYDCDDLKRRSATDDLDQLRVDVKDIKVRVRMIDFNHALKNDSHVEEDPTTDKDENYLSGVQRLIKVFENLGKLYKDPSSLSTLFPSEETN